MRKRRADEPTSADGNDLDFILSPGTSLEERTAQSEALRERCPLAKGATAPNEPTFWSMMRYRDIVSAARDTSTFSNGLRVRLEGRRPPLESDPPEHAQIRKLLTPFFSMKAVNGLEPLSRNLARTLVEPIVEAGGGDLNRSLARPLPTQILLHLIGQPISDWESVKAWSEANRPTNMNDVAGQEEFAAADRALWDYSRSVIANRVSTPRDPKTDPITALLVGGVDGDRLNVDLAVGVVRLLLAAGHDSTTQSIGLCIAYLAREPDQQDRLRHQPEEISAAIEEILRMETPVVAMPRIVARDIDLHGRRLKAGERLMLNWASANRDPEVFEQPNEYVLDRSPNRHLVFGSGIHTCIGANLARREIRVVIEELLAQTRCFEFSEEPMLQHMIHHGFETLPMKVEPA